MSVFKLSKIILFLLLNVNFAFADRILVDDSDWVGTDAAKTRYKPYYKSQLNKQVGLGVMAGGPLGLGGAVLELNFIPQWTFSAGIGGSNQFTSFFGQAKKLLRTGDWSPYIGVGVARWQRSSKEGFDYGGVFPGFLSKKFVSDSDKSKGIIAETLLYPSLGIQFSVFKDIPVETSAFFVEVLMLADLDDFQIVPTGAGGWVYYF